MMVKMSLTVRVRDAVVHCPAAPHTLAWTVCLACAMIEPIFCSVIRVFPSASSALAISVSFSCGSTLSHFKVYCTVLTIIFTSMLATSG